MSQTKIRAALETALNAMTPALATAWENNTFTPPVATVPYQKAVILYSQPENPSFGDAFYREKGIFQVTLFYPLKQGTSAITARGELLRSIFKRGATFIKDDICVTIERTPEIPSGTPDGDRWAMPVKIRFFSHIFN